VIEGAIATERPPKKAVFLLPMWTQLDCVHARAYIIAVRKILLFTPLFLLLAAAIWFMGAAWSHLAGDPIPTYGWFAIGGGVLLSFAVGGGLMALVFYSNRHGYDDLSGGDGEGR
jgi:hypothetical protein